MFLSEINCFQHMWNQAGCPVNCFLCRAPNHAPMTPMRVFFHGLSCTKLCSNACFFFAVCSAPNPAPMRAFSRCLSCTKSCSHACFFLRFVVHQIVLQCVLLFAVHRAPNRAVWSELCWKFMKVRALVFILFVLWKWKKCGKTKNSWFCIVFLFGA